MSVNKYKFILFIIIMLTSFCGVDAQIKLHSFADVGENNASDGVFIKNSYRSSYQHNQYIIEAGVQFDLISDNPNVFTGNDIMASRRFLIKNFPFDVKGFFMLNRFSDLFYETNWGARIETQKVKHFLFGIGTNFKTYTINSTGVNEYNVKKSNRKLRENFNLIYIVTGYLKPQYTHWNMGLSITNIDYFVINQSTNPVFNLQMKYKIKPDFTVYVESWYKPAGIFNIYANYFGYFFRGGIKWKI